MMDIIFSILVNLFLATMEEPLALGGLPGTDCSDVFKKGIVLLKFEFFRSFFLLSYSRQTSAGVKLLCGSMWPAKIAFYQMVFEKHSNARASIEQSKTSGERT